MSASYRFLILLAVGGLCVGSGAKKLDAATFAIGVLSVALGIHIFLTDIRKKS